MIKSFTTAAIATLASLAGCDPDAGNTPEPPTRPAQVIYIPEDWDTPFDARSGDTIILIMTDDGDQLARCDHSGGELIYNPHTTIYTCEGVDF